ncbi:3'-5' exonuclease [Acinetobacter sp.]|uniref:3'-5' exonuclease n=1 Tax=Acinetobacter sp. TaxID=472 RepID=UPI003CFFA12D
MNNVMLDLETLSANSNAFILSIGAVEFDFNNETLGREFSVNISMTSEQKHSEIDPMTVSWWVKQSKEARLAAFDESNTCPLINALNHFSTFLKECGPDVKVWGNGASFDNVILSNAYKNANIKQPWKFRNDRDLRTLVALAEDNDIAYASDLPREGVHHKALDDAKHQANVACYINRRLLMKWSYNVENE